MRLAGEMTGFGLEEYTFSRMPPVSIEGRFHLNIRPNPVPYGVRYRPESDPELRRRFHISRIRRSMRPISGISMPNRRAVRTMRFLRT